MKKATVFLFLIALFFSCGTKKNINVLHYFPPTSIKIDVMGAGQTVPNNLILIGNISIEDTGITSAKNCTYSKVVKEAILLAQQMGGNILYIVTHHVPDSNSTCHRINVNVYRFKE